MIVIFEFCYLDYGLDVLGFIRIFFLVGGSVIGVVVMFFVFFLIVFLWLILLKIVFVIVVFYSFGMGCFMIYGSKIMKVWEVDWFFDVVVWCGDEYVFDVGCGCGLMFVKVVKRFISGKVIGVDIW